MKICKITGSLLMTDCTASVLLAAPSRDGNKFFTRSSSWQARTLALRSVVRFFAFGFLFALVATAQTVQRDRPVSLLYLNPQGGITADAAVALALENNGEMQALRNEVDAWFAPRLLALCHL